MTKILKFTFCGLLLVSLCRAEDRGSDVGIMLNRGKNSYQSNQLKADFGTSEHWQINLNAQSEKSNGAQTASMLSLAANTDSIENTHVRFGFVTRKEPDEVYANGLTLGAGYVLSTLWDSKLETELSVDGSFQQYRQGKNKVRQRVKENNSIPYNSVSIDLSQELSESIKCTLSYTKYSYGGSTPEELSAAISNRLVVPSGLLALVDGLPKSSAGFGFDIDVGSFSFSPAYSHTILAYDEKVSGLSLGIDYNFNSSWTGNFEGSSSSSSTGGASSTLVGLGATYRW